ncbi:PadR family transcriptional regulator [Candidatus Bipolaricaulota bacterium]|nr:PadR family transcriptional regulator [Candidatus Bipolaricaulota bacterium]
MMERTKSLRQPFPVAHAVLACLMEGPGHGYRIRRRLDAAFADLWHIPTSQLYRVLERLESNGWAKRQVEREGQRPERTVYTISAQGQQEFWEWVDRPITRQLELVAAFWTKLYFLRRIAPSGVDAWLARQIEALRHRLSSREGIDATSDDQAFCSLVQAYRDSQLEAAIRWLKEQSGAGRFG